MRSLAVLLAIAVSSGPAFATGMELLLAVGRQAVSGALVTGLALSSNPTQITATWNAVAAASSYNVYYSTSSSLTSTTYDGVSAYPAMPSATAGKYAGVTGTSFSINGPLTQSTVYYIRVSARTPAEGPLNTSVSTSAGAAPALCTKTTYNVNTVCMIPAGVTSMTVTLNGGGGGAGGDDSYGDNTAMVGIIGQRVTGSITGLTPGTALTLKVGMGGGGGVNGWVSGEGGPGGTGDPSGGMGLNGESPGDGGGGGGGGGRSAIRNQAWTVLAAAAGGNAGRGADGDLGGGLGGLGAIPNVVPAGGSSSAAGGAAGAKVSGSNGGAGGNGSIALTW